MKDEKKETKPQSKVPTENVVGNDTNVNNDLYTALASFQQEVPAIVKGTEGYGYKYAELSSILEIINPILAKYKLGFTQLLEGKSLKTVLFHTPTGQTLISTIDIPQDVSLSKMNDFQVLGSGITYLRRYSLSSILGLVTDVDNDAAGEQKPREKKPVSNINSFVPPTKLQLDLINKLKEEKDYTSEQVATELGFKAGQVFDHFMASKVIDWLTKAPKNDPFGGTAAAIDRGENV